MSSQPIHAVLMLLALALIGVAPTPSRSASESKPVLTGTVTRVVDGDTIDVRLASGSIRVRLYGIDAPEHNQPGGAQSTAALTALVAGQSVDLEPYSQDRYDRMIANVYLGELDVNAELVRTGHAWAFRHYMTAADTEFCTLEAEARADRSGLWALPAGDIVAPWEFRHHARPHHFTDYSRETAAHCVATIGAKSSGQ